MSLPYLPAELQKCADRWQIVFYQTNPDTGSRERIRRTFDLNRIKDKKQRLVEAMRLIEMINRRLPAGYPFDDHDNHHFQVLLTKAIRNAVQYKCKTTERYKSAAGYQSLERIFHQFLKAKSWQDLRLHQFHREHAQEFLRWAVIARGVANGTRNTYLLRMRTLFYEIIDMYKEYDMNPFSGIRTLPVTGSPRRALSKAEQKAIIRAAQDDKQLLFAILLQYHCFIRPGELRKLKICDFNFEDGLIVLPGSITKNKRTSTVQIPDSMLDFLLKFGFERYPSDYYVFGRGRRPGKLYVGQNTLRNRHNAIIKALKAQKVITDTRKIKFYSWKDTGVVELVRRKVNIREIQLQIRHSSLEMTQKYLESLGFQYSEIKTLDNRLI